MTYTEQNTKTWLDLSPGATCRHCKTRIERGHRYYEEETRGSVIHYCCLKQEQQKAA